MTTRRPLGYVRLALQIALAAVLLGVAQQLDTRAHLKFPAFSRPSDITVALRELGFFPVWVVIAAIFACVDAPAWGKRAPFLLISAAGSGLLAEGLKLVIRRQRPEPGFPGYVFEGWMPHAWRTSALGMPSSHAAVAFGAACALAYLHPRAGWVFLLAAAGCASTRVIAGQHYLSDTIAGAYVGFLVPTLIVLIHRRNHPPTSPALAAF